MGEIRNFWLKGVLFSLLVASPLILPLLLPLGTFSLNQGGALTKLKADDKGPLYSLKFTEKNETGDLARGTAYEKSRKTKWITDEFGYRNLPNTSEYADIVVLGDSNTLGYRLNQEETLSSVLEAKTGLRAYNMAPSGVYDFIDSKLFNENPPKVVVLALIERHLHTLRDITPTDYPVFPPNHTINSLNNWSIDSPGTPARLLEEYYDRALKLSAFRYLKVRSERLFYRPPAKKEERIATINSSVKNETVPAFDRISFNGKTIMFFFKDAILLEVRNNASVSNFTAALLHYDEYFRQRDIKFVVAIIPDKENIYFEDVPNEMKPIKYDYMQKIITELDNAGVSIVDTQSAFETAKNEGKELYQFDDTHWAPGGVNLTADLIIEKMLLS